jgi:hypothetical protein
MNELRSGAMRGGKGTRSGHEGGERKNIKYAWDAVRCLILLTVLI